MDYAKMLFAFHVRQEAIQTLEQQTEGMEPEESDQFLKDQLAKTVANIVDQVETYATLIQQAKDQRSAADSKAYYEQMGNE